jgi:2-dehydro-3-deoxyphosphogluconate aldolase/(4S)-4-hydroxy-2-oxoglutarate aldolase
MMPSQFPPETLQRIQQCGVIAVLVIDDADHAVPLAKALLEGGVDCMELTLRTPVAIEALRQVSRQVPNMLAGIGTILSPQQVDAVLDVGASFGVAPGLNPRVVRHAQQKQLPFAPGILTPSDIETAIELGCRQLKFFPAQPSGGVAYLRSINAPYAHLGLQYIPLGGIDAENLGEYLGESAVPAVGGSWIAPRQLIQANDWATITSRAAAARELITQTRTPKA